MPRADADYLSVLGLHIRAPEYFVANAVRPTKRLIGVARRIIVDGHRFDVIVSNSQRC